MRTPEEQELIEAVFYLRGVLPPDAKFDALVRSGANGDESHTISGDDLAGACHSLSVLMKHFGLDGESYLEDYKFVHNL